MRVLTIFGTRPEAIKCIPVVRELGAKGIEHVTCVTGQHRQMLDPVLSLFSVVPDYDLNLMKAGQTLQQLTADLIPAVSAVIDKVRPDWILVQGDTTTAFVGALAGYYQKIKVGHIEAGLRTQNIYSPWPEEGNRKLIGALAKLHFAPTEVAAQNLIHEGVSALQVAVTGNTVIDALNLANQLMCANEVSLQSLQNRFSFLNPEKRLILVTGHRRESFGGGFERICQALAELSQRPDTEIIYPVHLNPQVSSVVHQSLGNNRKNIHLVPPLDYEAFLYLMKRSYIILTDSGGVQEEAPTLGKPVLVMREHTERPEAVRAGTSELVGTDPERILAAANLLLDQPIEYQRRAKIRNPYGDGFAAKRIVKMLVDNLD